MSEHLQKRNLNISLLRAALIFLIVANHLRAFLFPSFSENVSIMEKAFYYMTGWGHYAVLGFLMLSGNSLIHRYLMGGGKNNGLNKLPPQFLVKRFFRLECVLIPALGITWAFQIIGETFGHIQLYEGTYDFGGMINHNMVSSLNFKNLIGTILFLNGMAFEIQPFGCNTPLWYLPVQFWIYVMFFLSYNILVSCRRIKVFYSIILALVTLWIGEKIIFYAIVWLIGGLVPIVEKQCSEAFKGMKFLKYFGLILSLGLVLVVRVLSAGLYADMIFILSFSLLYLCMVSIGNLNGIVGLASDGLAKFSFTLYAVTTQRF